MPMREPEYSVQELQDIADEFKVERSHVLRLVTGHEKTHSRELASRLSASTGEVPLAYLPGGELSETAKGVAIGLTSEPDPEPVNDKDVIKERRHTPDFITYLLKCSSQELAAIEPYERASITAFVEMQVQQSYLAGRYLLRQLGQRIEALRILQGTGNQQSVQSSRTGEKGIHTLRQIEEKAIMSALEGNKFNRTLAASELGITARTLRNKINKMKRRGRKVSDNPKSFSDYLPRRKVEAE